MNTKRKTSVFGFDGKEHLLAAWDYDDFDLGEPDMPIHTALAYKLNNDLHEGHYLEIGSGHYKHQNNTYFLETKYNWKGVSIDNSKSLVDEFNENRKNKCLYGDAITFDFKSYLDKNNFPKKINFLSIDIDFQSHKFANLLALLNLPTTTYLFNIIIIEHGGGVMYEMEEVKDLQRKILTILGYELIIRGKTDDVWCLKENIRHENGLLQLSGMSWNL